MNDQQKWNPIHTVPTDERRVLILFDDGHVEDGQFYMTDTNETRYVLFDGDVHTKKPVGWLPYPGRMVAE